MQSFFSREAGDRSNPSILLLHGVPASSIMFKNLMTALADSFHLVAPDKKQFEYTFKNISIHINKFTEKISLNSFTIYLHDYGCPIGLRLCVNHPDKIQKIIVVNGNTYEEGLAPQWDETRDYWENPTEEKKKKVSAFLSEEGVKMQYMAGLSDELLLRVSPEAWILASER